MEQFAKKFEQVPREGVGEGREIAVTPGTDRPIDPARTIPSPLAGQAIRGRNERGPGAAAPDPEGGNRQGIRSVAPEEYRSQFDAYRKRISRSAPAPAPARRALGVDERARDADAAPGRGRPSRRGTETRRPRRRRTEE
jgi:hypothetical protein